MQNSTNKQGLGLFGVALNYVSNAISDYFEPATPAYAIKDLPVVKPVKNATTPAAKPELRFVLKLTKEEEKKQNDRQERLQQKDRKAFLWQQKLYANKLQQQATRTKLKATRKGPAIKISPIM